MSADAVEANRRLLARFANSFDLKDWEGLGGCLANQLHTDYSALRGTPPETLTRARFLELRRTALQELQTQHLAGLPEIAVDGDTARIRAPMAIFRRRPDGVVFNTHCLYLFETAREDGAWRIRSIVQHVYWSDGQAAIHAGAANA